MGQLVHTGITRANLGTKGVVLGLSGQHASVQEIPHALGEFLGLGAELEIHDAPYRVRDEMWFLESDSTKTEYPPHERFAR